MAGMERRPVGREVGRAPVTPSRMLLQNTRNGLSDDHECDIVLFISPSCARKASRNREGERDREGRRKARDRDLRDGVGHRDGDENEDGGELGEHVESGTMLGERACEAASASSNALGLESGCLDLLILLPSGALHCKVLLHT